MNSCPGLVWRSKVDSESTAERGAGVVAIPVCWKLWNVVRAVLALQAPAAASTGCGRRHLLAPRGLGNALQRSLRLAAPIRPRRGISGVPPALRRSARSPASLRGRRRPGQRSPGGRGGSPGCGGWPWLSSSGTPGSAAPDGPGAAPWRESFGRRRRRPRAGCAAGPGGWLPPARIGSLRLTARQSIRSSDEHSRKDCAGAVREAVDGSQHLGGLHRATQHGLQRSGAQGDPLSHRGRCRSFSAEAPLCRKDSVLGLRRFWSKRNCLFQPPISAWPATPCILPQRAR